MKKYGIFLFIGLIDYIGIGLIYPIFSFLLFQNDQAFLPSSTSLSIRGLYLGILMALTPLGQFFSAPILGALSDIKGRKIVLIFSLWVGILGYLMSIYAIMFTQLVALFFSRILVGISAGSVSVLQAALSDFSTKEEKPHVFSLYNMTLGLGFTIGPFLGGKLSVFSFAAPFAFCGVMLASALLVLHFFKMPTVLLQEKTLSLFPFKKVFQANAHRSLFLCTFIFGFGWSYFFEFIPVYLMGYHQFTSNDVGNFYAYAGGIYAVCCAFLIRPILKNFSLEKVFFHALWIAGTYSLLFLWIENSFYLWVFLPALLFFIALIFPSLSTMIALQAKKEEQGEVLGMLQSVQSLAFMLSPFLSGGLVGITMSMPIVVGSLCMLLAAFLFMRTKAVNLES